MVTALTDIFGDEIIVADGSCQVDREYSGFAGADGLVSMHLGSRGSDSAVAGIVRGTGESYAAARANARLQMLDIEDTVSLDADDYTFGEDTFENVVWDSVKKIPDANGKIYQLNSKGEVIVRFIITGKML